MKNRTYNVLALMSLGIVLMVWLGCGSGDEPVVKEDSPIVTEGPSTNSNSIGSLNGQVAVIEGVQINVRVLHNDKLITSGAVDPNGRYRVDDIEPGTYTVQITARGYDAVEQTVQVTAGQATALDKVALKALEIPVPHIQGLVLDQTTKKALNKIRVQLIDDAGNVHEVLTNEAGVFEFENVPADRQLTLIVNDIEFYERREIPINPIPAGQTAKIDVELAPLPRLRGLLLDGTTKKALQGVDVQLINEAGDVREARTRTTGIFEFESLPTDQRFTLVVDIEFYKRQEIPINPIPAGQTAKVEVELGLINPDQLPIGDGLKLGTKSPAFKLPDGDGKIHTLADYAGQKVVLLFDRGSW